MPEPGIDNENLTVLNNVTVQKRSGEKNFLPACFAIIERSTVVLIYCGEHPKSELNGVVWGSRQDNSKANGASKLYCIKSCRKAVPKVLNLDYD